MARSSFKFRLQRLLDVREMREKQAQQELQARRAQVVFEEAVLVRLQGEEQRLRADQSRPLETGENLHEFGFRRVWLEKEIVAKGQEQQAQRAKIDQAKQRVVEQMDIVRQRGIEVKALEKLQEKQREEHRLEQLREEGLFLDDLAGQGFIRRRTLGAIVEGEESASAAAAAAPREAPWT